MSLQNGYEKQTGVPSLTEINAKSTPVSEQKAPESHVVGAEKSAIPLAQSVRDISKATQSSIKVEKNDPGFYFENQLEFIAFCSIHGDKYKNLLWLQGDEYLKRVNNGIRLIEQGKCDEAIEALTESLQYNPVGLSARFEICEAFLMSKDTDSAKATLMNMVQYLISNDAIARFYRRLGYIYTEKEEYRIAAACYRFSRKYADSQSINNELKYILAKAGLGVFFTNASKVLKDNGIPILEAFGST